MDFGQNSETLGLRFRANMELHTQLAALANCLKVIDFS